METAARGAASPAPEAEGEAQAAAAARARAYLDLWERHLVHAALHGPGPAPRASEQRG